MTFLRNFGALGLILLASLAALDGYFAAQVVSKKGASPVSREYFLNVGAGESELAVLPGGPRIVIDAGPTGAASKALAAVLPSGARYIDLAIVSYPSSDRFGGFVDLLDQYDLGAFVWSGRMPTGAAAGDWQALLKKLKTKRIPVVTVGAGDRIRMGTGAAAAEIDVLSPDADFLKSADPTESSIVALVRAGNVLRTLFMGAAGMTVERHLSAQGLDLHADVLKVAAHGARYATGAAFLRAVRPAAAVIEAGGKTAAGLPAKETLARISSSTDAFVFRTDLDGTVTMWLGENGSLKAAAAK